MVIREKFDIKEVKFNFENCDSLKIDYKFIKNLSFKGITLNYYDSKTKYVDYVNIKIDKKILNKEFKQFNINEYATNVLNRLNFCDIISIEIIYNSLVFKTNKCFNMETNKKIHFIPKWCENDWEINHFQYNTIDNNGDLIIEIKKAEN